MLRRVALGVLGVGVGAAAADPHQTQAAAACVPRTARSLATFALVAADVKWSLSRAAPGTAAYAAAEEQVHRRTAAALLRLCRANGGIYTKAGQMLSTAQGLPPAYRAALASLQDAAPPRPFAQVDAVLSAELGAPAATLFAAFEPVAAAAASLAQVHRARLHDGRDVAVKVQYPGLARAVAADLLTLRVLAAAALALAAPGAVPDLSFLVSSLRRNLACELDFVAEGRNAERVAAAFASITPRVATAPKVVWEHTSSRVLTMQWVDGCRVDDAAALCTVGLQPRAVADALADVVGAMAFRFGFVHGDLHPGNIRVLPAPPASRTAALLRRASPAPLLVLLDHGLYATLEEPLRLAYCALWQAVALGDGAAAAAAGAVLVPGTGPQWALLTMRPEQLNKQQRSDVRAAAGLQTAADVGEFLEGVPPALGVAFRAQGLLRSVTLSLGLPRNARMWRMLTEATIGMHYRNGVAPLGATAAAHMQLRLALVRIRFLARVAALAARWFVPRLWQRLAGSAPL